MDTVTKRSSGVQFLITGADVVQVTCSGCVGEGHRDRVPCTECASEEECAKYECLTCPHCGHSAEEGGVLELDSGDGQCRSCGGLY